MVPEADETRVVLGFLLNFAKFTEWPQQSAAAPAEFRICVVGDDNAADAMRRLASGRTLQGAPVAVTKPKVHEELRHCRIVFFGSDLRRRTLPLTALRQSPVLTVSMVRAFAAQGGMIELFLHDTRMRFAVNRKALEAGGLRVSPELLELASPR